MLAIANVARQQAILYTEFRKMLKNSILKCQIMYVNDEIDTSNFQNQQEVTQINRIPSNRLMEYREGG